MEEIDVFKSMREAVDGEPSPFADEKEVARLKLIASHKAWLKKIKKEYPSPYQFFKVGVYIRYFNQTKYDNYLDYTIATFFDFSLKFVFSPMLEKVHDRLLFAKASCNLFALNLHQLCTKACSEC